MQPLCLCGEFLLGIHQPQRHRGHRDCTEKSATETFSAKQLVNPCCFTDGVMSEPRPNGECSRRGQVVSTDYDTTFSSVVAWRAGVRFHPAVRSQETSKLVQRRVFLCCSSEDRTAFDRRSGQVVQAGTVDRRRLYAVTADECARHFRALVVAVS